MDHLHVLILLLLSIGAAVQSKPRLCNEGKQKEGELQNEDDVSARSFSRLSILRPGLIFRGSASSANLPQSDNKRPGNIGLLHGSGGVPNGGYGVIHGGGEKHLLNRNKIFGQGIGLKNNSLSQKIGSLINYQPFGILSGNSLNVNRTQQNNSGPSYQVYLPSGLHQIHPVGEQSVGGGGGGGHGGTSGGLLNHGFRPHHHMGGPAVHQGGHLSGLLGHHQSHPHHSLHPLTHHSHHGSHGPAVLGSAGIGGARPGHHQHNGGLLGATHLSGGGAGPIHGKPGGLGGLGLIHGGLVGGGQTYGGNIVGHRPLTHGALGLVHGAFGNQGSTSSNSEVNNAVQTQQHHGGLIGLLHNGLGAQGVLLGGVGGNNHFVGGSGLGSSNIFGQHGVFNLIHGGHSGNQGGNFQTVTGSELKPGHVYLHLGALGVQHGGQTGGTAGSSFQSVGGSSLGSGQVYGHGGEQVFTQSGQVAQGQIFGTGSNYQSGGTSTSQSGQFQSQHNLHQGTLNQGGAAVVTSNTGGYGVAPGTQSYQGSIYETQWRPPHAVSSTTGSSAHSAGTVGSSSGSLNSYNQVNQGSNNFVSGTSEQNLYGNQNIYEGNQGSNNFVSGTSEQNLYGNQNIYEGNQGSNNFVSGTSEQNLYGNQNIYEGNNNQYATSQSTNGNYYNSGQIPTTDHSGSYGFNQGYPVGLYNQTFGQGLISGGTSTQHSHQSSSSSSFGSNSSSQAEESSSQESHYSGGNLVGVNSGDTSYTSVVQGKPSSINYVGGDQSSHHLNSNTQGQSNYISGTNAFQNSGGGSGQYMGNYGSAVFSGGYPHQQDNYNTNDQKQGNYAHGSLIYVIQQSPLADEDSYTGENEASVSGSIAGSGAIGGATSNMYNNKLVDKTSSVSSGDSSSSISTSHSYLGPNSANEVKYGGTSSSSSFQSGSQGSTSKKPINTSGNVLSGGSASHSFNSSPSIGSSGPSGSSGSSYNTQYNRPSLGSAAVQSTDSSSQTFSSSSATPQYGTTNSAAVSGNFGSSSSSASSNANGNSFSNVHKENAVSESAGTDSNSNSWQSVESGASAGSSNGEVLSTQTNGLGQYTSGGSVSSSSHMASTTNHGLQFNNSGSSSKPTSASLSTNQVLISGMGHSSSSTSSSGTSATAVGTSNTGETHGTMPSTQTNISGQYGHSGTSSAIESTNNESSYNGISFGQTEPTEPSLSASKGPLSEGEHQSSAITSNVGAPQQHHISGSSSSTGVLVGGESGYTSSNGEYSSNYGNKHMLTGNTAGSSSSLSAASGNSEQSSAHGSIYHGGSDQTSTIGGGQGSYAVTSTAVNNKEGLNTNYNNNNAYHDKTGTHMTNLQDGSTFQVANSNTEQSSSNIGTMYQSSVSGSNQHTGTESVSFISSNSDPPPNTVSSFSETNSAHSVGSQMYGVSPNKGGHVSGSGGYGNQASSFAVHSNTNNEHSALGTKESQASGMIETVGGNSQHTFNSAPSGSSSGITSQSSSLNSNPEIYGSFNKEHVGSGTTGQVSNQYSNINQLGMTSSTSGGSGSYESVNKNQDKYMISSGSLVSGSSGNSEFEASKYPSSNSNTQISGSTHGDNQLFSSMSSNFGGMGNNLPSTSASSQHHGTAGYTPGGNTEIISSNIKGHSSMVNAQGHSPVGLTTGGGINKEFTGTVQTNSFRYPGQYTFKYGYVHPNNMYTRIGYPPPNSYDSTNIVYSGDVNPNTGSNGFYYHYSTAENPIKISSVESYPIQTSDKDYLNQPLYPVGNDQSGPIPLSSNVDEEDDSYEETQINNGVTGNLQGHFEHSSGGNIEGSINRPFQGGLSFVGNHELNSGVSGSVSGHLGNFQGFLGNAANKVGSLISGVGQVVGIIRDPGESQATGGVEPQGYIIATPQKVEGILRTNNQHILAPLLRAQDEQNERTFPVYIQETYDKTFSDGKQTGTELQTSRLILPSNIAAFREPKGVTQEAERSNSEVVES